MSLNYKPFTWKNKCCQCGHLLILIYCNSIFSVIVGHAIQILLNNLIKCIITNSLCKLITKCEPSFVGGSWFMSFCHGNLQCLNFMDIFISYCLLWKIIKAIGFFNYFLILIWIRLFFEAILYFRFSYWNNCYYCCIDCCLCIFHVFILRLKVWWMILGRKCIASSLKLYEFCWTPTPWLDHRYLGFYVQKFLIIMIHTHSLIVKLNTSSYVWSFNVLALIESY